jgi:hypothetical protein
MLIDFPSWKSAFKEVPVIGEGGKVSLFSEANQPQKKVSSKAA